MGKLSMTIDLLATDKGDLLSKLEESLQNLNELRNEYTEILTRLTSSESEKKQIVEAYKLQEKKVDYKKNDIFKLVFFLKKLPGNIIRIHIFCMLEKEIL